MNTVIEDSVQGLLEGSPWRVLKEGVGDGQGWLNVLGLRGGYSRSCCVGGGSRMRRGRLRGQSVCGGSWTSLVAAPPGCVSMCVWQGSPERAEARGRPGQSLGSQAWWRVELGSTHRSLTSPRGSCGYRSRVSMCPQQASSWEDSGFIFGWCRARRCGCSSSSPCCWGASRGQERSPAREGVSSSVEPGLQECDSLTSLHACPVAAAGLQVCRLRWSGREEMPRHAEAFSSPCHF